MLIPTGPWLPDLADLGNPGSTVAQNVVPVSPTDYGPFPSFVQGQQAALDDPIIGAQSYEGVDGAGYVFAGTYDNLYLLKNLGASFSNVSISGGYFLPNSAWNFAQYEQRVMATNHGRNATIGAGIQSYVIGSSSNFALLSSTAPLARYMDMVKVFLMAANTYDPTGGIGAQRIWWSAAGDPTNWPTPGSNTAIEFQSSYVDLAGDMGEITGIVGNLGNADVAIFFERGIWTGQYVGPPTVFNFTPCEGARGCVAPQSIVRYGGVAFYLGLDGFYSFDGVNSNPIGVGRVDQWFFKNASGTYPTAMNGAVNTPQRCVAWSFPTTAAGSCNDAILIFHIEFGNFSLVYMPMQWILRAFPAQVTIDNIQSVFGYANLDAIPISLDSPIFNNNSPVPLFAGFNGSNNFGTINGPALPATVTTTEARPNPNGRAFLRTARPLIDGLASSVALISRNNESDTPIQTASAAPNGMGECPMRGDARFMRFQVQTAAGTPFSHLHGVDAQVVNAGWR